MALLMNQNFIYLKKLDNNKFKFEKIDHDNLVILYNNLGDSMILLMKLGQKIFLIN